MSQTQINLKEKTEEGLKALAYDVQKVINQYSGVLQAVEGEIQLRATQTQGKGQEEQPEPSGQAEIGQ